MAKYIEPEDYIPKEIRKKYGLGEFNEAVNKEIAEIEASEKEKANKAIRDFTENK